MLKLHFDVCRNYNFIYELLGNIYEWEDDIETYSYVEEYNADVSIVYSLQLNKLNKGIIARLCEKSDFFKRLFRREEEIMSNRLTFNDKEEYGAFFILMMYILSETIDLLDGLNENYVDSFYSYYDLYILADKYLLLELKNMLSIFLKHHISNETAAYIFFCC